jgi:glutathione S-transferase
MITLYGFSNVIPPVVGETRDLRIQWALEETGLPYRVHGLDFMAGDLKTESYRRFSPFGQVPALEDDGLILSESGAMLLYVAEKAGKLGAEDFESRMQATRWCFAALNTLEPAIMQLVAIDFAGDGDPTGKERRPAAVEQIEWRLAVLEDWLSQRDYLTGTEFTVADLLMATILREIRKAGILIDYPRLSAYSARCLDRPAWQRTAGLYAERLGVEPARLQ